MKTDLTQAKLKSLLHYDPANGIRNDNRIVNLREATASENLQNQRRARSDSKTGILGVTTRTGSDGKKFVATIGIS